MASAAYRRRPLLVKRLPYETRIPAVKASAPASTDTPEDTPPDVEEPADIDPLTLGDFYYYQYDHLGSVTGLSDETGLLTTQYSYTAFGLTRTSSGPTQGNLYRYSSKAYDGAAGLYYYGARYYDPQVGRWLTQDPLGIVDGPNRYLFVSNDPVNYVDPWGLEQLIFGLPYTGDLVNQGMKSWRPSEMGQTQSGKLGKPNAVFSKPKDGKGGSPSNKKANKQVDDVAKEFDMTEKQRWSFRKYIEKLKEKVDRGGADNFTYQELRDVAKEFLDE